MKHTNSKACLTMELLVFVRDERPSIGRLIEWLGPSDAGRFYVLKKAGFLIVQNGYVHLSPEHTDKDQKRFVVGSSIFFLDKGQVYHVRWATKDSWKAIIGTFANDPLYDEAMRLGREWGENQHDETN